MNEFFKKFFTKVTALWAGWSMQQRIICGVVILVLLGGTAALFRVSSTPVLTSVIDAPIRDEAALDRIVLRLNQENVKVTVTPNGLVQVADEPTARQMRALLIREDLIPSGLDPWQVFDRERWTITDMERNVNLQRALTRMITDHIRSIEDIDDANVTIVWPARELFRADQNPVSASVIITPKPGSDITENRMKIEGVQKLLQFAIEGLQSENVVITDYRGLVLNDFEGMAAMDRLNLIERENKFIRVQETHYRALVLNSLQGIFSSDRVRDLNIKIDMDMSKKTVDTTEHFPVTIKPRTPGLPYDDSILKESILVSETVSETTWTGTGYNPEGPPGVEGQTPPAFRDMSNLYGKMEQTTRTHNEEINRRQIQEEKSPVIDRITVSVNIDGRWKMTYDKKGNPNILPDGSIEREYISVPPEDLRKAEALVRDAIGYSSARGDSVTVQDIPFDRTAEFALEDAEYFRKKQVQTTIIIFLSGLILLLFGFIVFRMVSREMERRRRLAEEERARREQMLRESAMAEAGQDGMDVSISLEERTKMELMEAAINLAKEHPEDAAQLIRTWLLEE
ncbi:MAG: flagellar M-ring protein FliF [Treponema sp.]|nr:flagellar M-ring protein FliF [Treponema sp.]MCL2272128.1 flagellar M-ring protein FliF [Treponema sp.]